MFVIQRVDVQDVWHDLETFVTFAEAQEVYLTKTPRRWHRIIERVGSTDLIVR